MDHFTEVAGEKGWELVSVVPVVSGSHWGHSGETGTRAHWLYFKKPVEEQ